jgi:hypothetical protein
MGTTSVRTNVADVLDTVFAMAFLTGLLIDLTNCLREALFLPGYGLVNGAENVLRSMGSNGPDINPLSIGPDMKPLSRGPDMKPLSRGPERKPLLSRGPERGPEFATRCRGRALKEDVLSNAAAHSMGTFEKELNCS